MDRLYFAIAIAALFASVLFFSRENGKLLSQVAAFEEAKEWREKMAEKDRKHQATLDKNNQDHEKELRGLQDELIQKTATFEARALSDPFALGNDESSFINDFMRRNSDNSGDIRGIQTPNPPITEDETDSRNGGNP